MRMGKFCEVWGGVQSADGNAQGPQLSMRDVERETVEMGTLAARCTTSAAAADLYSASAGRGLARACPSADSSPYACSPNKLPDGTVKRNANLFFIKIGNA
jgi:hypothetical protein